MLDLIRRDAEKTSQADVARKIGVSRCYVCDILQGKRYISSTVAAHYGYARQVTKEVVFVKVTK